MGALSGNASYLRFTVLGDPPGSFPDLFERNLAARRFLPLTERSEELESAGWAPLEAPLDDGRALTRDLFHFGDLICVAFREDKVALPRPLVKHLTQRRVDEEEQESGETVPRKRRKAIELAVTAELRQRVLPRTRVVDVVWSLSRREVRMFGRGPIATERCAALFERTFELPVHQATYARRAFDLDLSTRAMGVLEGLTPAFLFDPLPLPDEDDR